MNFGEVKMPFSELSETGNKNIERFNMPESDLNKAPITRWSFKRTDNTEKSDWEFPDKDDLQEDGIADEWSFEKTDNQEIMTEVIAADDAPEQHGKVEQEKTTVFADDVILYDAGDAEKTAEQNDGVNENDNSEKNDPIQNKIDGLNREHEVQKELEKQYPEEEGYEIITEAYLRDSDGNIVKDPESGEARRIDFVVVKDGKVVDSIEVTSQTADKTEQQAKEGRIRDQGGNYVRDHDGNLIEFDEGVETRIERRD